MLIYCNGDSFTAGSELADDLIPGWPGYCNFETSPEYQKQVEDFKKLLPVYDKKYVDYNSCLDKNVSSLEFFDQANIGILSFDSSKQFIEKNRAWPAQLEQLDSNISTINRARGGAGITGIVYRTIFDIQELQDQGKNVDLVIIGLTSTERQEIFTKDHEYLMYERPVYSNAHWICREDFEIAKAFVGRYTLDEWYIKYLWNLVILNNSIRAMTGKYPMLLDTKFDNADYWPILEMNLETITNNSYKDFVYRILKYSRIQQSYEEFMLNIAKNTNLGFCPLGHFSKHSHKNIAKEILTILEKER